MKKSINEQVATNNFLETINELLGIKLTKNNVIIFYGEYELLNHPSQIDTSIMEGDF